uniref:GOLD domain-containing protein n=1 Tax=Bicosoecida sp. CB-2014 TaxID=1486930 RepID=A0A7S1G8D0_9STRA
MAAVGRVGGVVALAVVFALAAAPGADALFFKLKDGTSRCFIEEVPSDTLVVAEYKSPDTTESRSVEASVKSPSGAEVITRVLDAEGRFAFTSDEAGEHIVCFQLSGQFFGTPTEVRVDLRLNVGEMAIDYAEIARKEHLSTLELEVRKLNDKMRDVKREQNYQRSRELKFRDTSEATNSRVQWWSLFQTAVLVVSGVYQVKVLKDFFRSRRLTTKR